MSKDATENRLEEYADVFVDIFNNLILEGYGTLREEDVFPMSTRTYTRTADGEIRNGMSDIRKENRAGGHLQLICAMENQTGIDHTMPERVMGYEYSGYEEQIKRIQDENRKQKRNAGSKRIFRRQKLAPVVTGVLYYGDKKWKQPMRLHEMLEFPKEMDKVLRKHVAELLDVIWELSGDENYKFLYDKIRKKKLKRRKWNMCEIARELEKIGVEKGIEKGIFCMIRDNMEMGNEKDKILEKIVRYFSIPVDRAQGYYERAITQ